MGVGSVNAVESTSELVGTSEDPITSEIESTEWNVHSSRTLR